MNRKNHPHDLTNEIILITGLSGSGKSIALHALEDAGYFCVDNLPPELLDDLVQLEIAHPTSRRIAISIDVRSAQSLHLLPFQIEKIRQQGHRLKILFLESSPEILIRRFSETRRGHPLSKMGLKAGTSQAHLALLEAIEEERSLLSDLREQAYIIDTNVIAPVQLQTYIKDLTVTSIERLLLTFESFSYKKGIPLDADFIFDVRMLPNPYYDLKLRQQTGQDPDVIDFFLASPEMEAMFEQISQFLAAWLPPLDRNHRSYVTVAIGCTGGQHRSVYLAERLYETFNIQWETLIRHRELRS